MSTAPAPEPSQGWLAVARLLERQDGVVSRRQVLDAGLRPHDIEHMVRSRQWARLVPGVYVSHTGTPTWLQRAWVGVLRHWPAALAGESAVRAVRGPGWPARGRGDTEGPIEIVVAADRTVRAADGYRVTRSRSFESRVQWNTSPPRVRFEEALIDVAARASTDHAAIGVLADACQSRRTTAGRLLAGIGNRRRLARRAWLVDVLDDVASGTCSTLENVYLTKVERPHGLPRGRRQARAMVGARLMFRDVLYPEQGMVVELDGRLFHDSARQRHRDLERDLDALLDDQSTVRLGWGQCTDGACATAARLAAVLQKHGWRGEPHPCGPGCPVSRP